MKQKEHFALRSDVTRSINTRIHILFDSIDGGGVQAYNKPALNGISRCCCFGYTPYAIVCEDCFLFFCSFGFVDGQKTSTRLPNSPFMRYTFIGNVYLLSSTNKFSDKSRKNRHNYLSMSDTGQQLKYTTIMYTR